MEHSDNRMERVRGFQGLIAAPFTPMHGDGSINLQVIEQQAQALLDHGVRGAFVCGTTGEGPSLSGAERMAVAARWREVADERLHLIVHVGHNSVAEARQLAAHARQIGADAIAAVAPSFFRPRTVEDLVACCAEIAAGAPGLPFYYYHIPSMTDVCFAIAEFLRLARHAVPGLRGIKFTHDDLMDYARCVDIAGVDYDILFGRDEMLLAALVVGGHGAVGSTYNLAAPLFHRIIAAFNAGDIETARKAQAQAREMIAVFLKYGGLPAFKAAMQWRGVDCGPCRRPLVSLTGAQQEQLRSDLEHGGFLEQLLQ